MNYILNADGSFMTVDQIIADLLSQPFDEVVTAAILNDFKPPPIENHAAHMAHCDLEPYEGICKYGDDANCPALIDENMRTLHHHFAQESLLRWIRNSYGLWSKANPHVVLDPALDDPLFPDNLSAMIYERFAQVFKRKHRGTTIELSN